MIRVGEVDSEVVVTGGEAAGGGGGGVGRSVEVRVEELREVVRLLLDEELERRARATPWTQGWSPR